MHWLTTKNDPPWCHNRPDRPAAVEVNTGCTTTTFGERRQHVRPVAFFSDNRCMTWAGDDNVIVDPEHPRHGTNSGDYYPLAMGFARHCIGCIHCPAAALDVMRERGMLSC